MILANAARAECPDTGVRPVIVKAVTSGNGFITSDNAEVDLAGILTAGLGGEYVSKAETNEAREALSHALTTGTVSLAFAGPEKDRYGRLQAQVFAGGEWVQGALLRAGLARANPETADACGRELLAAEAEARDANSGAWGDRRFAVLAPEALWHKQGTFQIVEGVVHSVATVKSRVYLNFGDNWRTDFTITISPDDMKRFRHAKLKPKTLEGKRVRVRGWIESYYGAEIELAVPSALENLEPAAPAKTGHKRKKRPGPKATGPSDSE